MPTDPKHLRAPRQKAKKVLSEARGKLAPMSEEDPQTLLHKLSIYQTELEKQNEELRRSWEQLEESRSEYTDLYDFAPVGYMTLDRMGLITRANLTACGLFGIERSLFVKKPFTLFGHPESRDIFYFHIRKVLETASKQTCQLVVKRKDGSLFDAQLESLAVQVDGRPAVNAIVTDVTGRKAGEARHRYELLCHHSRDVVLLMRSDDGSILEANTAAENSYGYSRDELLKMSIYDLRETGTRGLTADQMARADAGGILFETTHRRKDGSTFPVEVSSQGVTIDGTRTLISVIRDITQRKRTEGALRDSLERFRALSEAAFEGIGFSEAGRILDVNDQLARMLGYEKNELIGAEVVSLVHPEDRPRVMKNIKEGRDSVIEHRSIRRDGVVITVAAHGKPFTYEGRDIRVTALRDITRHKQAEEALYKAHGELELRVEERTEELLKAYESLKKETKERERAEARLRQAHKMEAIGTLAGGIAHDFNNILAAMMGFSEITRDKSPEGSPARRNMERVLAAGIRGRELIKQILAFSRRAEQEKQPLRLAPAVSEALKLLRASLPSTIDIHMSLQSEKGFVRADPIQIQQVLMNLCTNAAHAMRQNGGTISVDLAGFSFSSPEDAPDPALTPGHYTRLTVTDTGEGMSREVLDRIFDPFFTTKAVGEGTGLGLSVVHGIVASHGGVVTVSSEPGRGSTFSVYLPKPLDSQSRGFTEASDTIPRGNERILFVDDEDDLVAIGDEMLTGLGYRVTARTGAREALELFRLDPSGFDLVITDQTMPEITGKELVEGILAIRPDTAIIMCTGFSHLVDADTAKAAGVRAFAMKPLTKQEIAGTIRRVLDERSSATTF